MESFFDLDGPAGRVMMASTASVQVCLEAGTDAADVARRWALTNALTPLLVAAFANSPLRLGLPTGFACSRQERLVAHRSDPHQHAAGPGPRRSVGEIRAGRPGMLVRRDPSHGLPVPA
jgi:glutamate--cysteine ligase